MIKLKFLAISLASFNIADALATSHFIINHGTYEELNPLLLFLYDYIHYNIILLIKILLLTIIIIYAYKYYIARPKLNSQGIKVFTILNIFLFLVVISDIYSILIT